MSRLVFKFGSYCQNHIMMFLTQLTYCIMVIRKIAKKREENAYMIIPRYKSFRAYYGSVYRELVGYTFLYQTAILTGSIVGYRLVWYTHHVQALEKNEVGLFLQQILHLKHAISFLMTDTSVR